MWWVFVKMSSGLLEAISWFRKDERKYKWLWKKASLINESSPPDGLSLTGPRQRRGHLLWDQGHRSRHTWILRELNRWILAYLIHLCARERLLCCAVGRVLRHHQQEPGQSDQSQRRGEAVHVLKRWRSRIQAAFNSVQSSFILLNHKKQPQLQFHCNTEVQINLKNKIGFFPQKVLHLLSRKPSLVALCSFNLWLVTKICWQKIAKLKVKVR